MKLCIFVGSSTEGLSAANALIKLLERELSEAVEIRPWNNAFPLSASNMESLEAIGKQADFAVLLFTPDDLLRMRRKTSPAPRDNLVFEAGFFMGSLGRDRCFVVQGRAKGLRVPSDLHGITVAPFSRKRGTSEWDLESVSTLIAKAVRQKGKRTVLSAQYLERLARVQKFAKRAKGYWWEKIFAHTGRSDWLSYFSVQEDLIHNSISISPGKAYTPVGALGSHWECARLIPRIKEDECQVDYHWEGKYVDKPGVRYHGLGSITYMPRDRERFESGQGEFWDINEGTPRKSSSRTFELRRMSASDYRTMRHGTQSQRRQLVVKTLQDWK